MKKANKPATTLKPGTTLHRAFGVERSAINEAARTVELAFASETAYERWWGVEILDCTATAMRMGRLASGGPLLCDHDTKDQIGVIESVQLGADRVARAVVRFGKSARAEEVFRDVVDGIRRNVSVGYQIHQAVLVETNDDQDTYRVSDWEPYEVSLVSVPADASVGIGRSAGSQSDSPVITIPQISTKESTVTTAAPEVIAAAPAAPAISSQDVRNAEAGAPAISSQDVRNAEAGARRQASEMLAIGDQFARYNGVALAKDAIEKGQSVDQLRGLIMNAMTAAQTTQVTNLDLSAKEQRKFSVFKAIRAISDKTWKGAEFELECHNEILKRTGLQESIHGGFYMPMDVQKRDLTVGTPTAGGNLVATDLQPQNFIDLLRAKSRAAELGMTMLTGLVGNVAIPKLTGAATAYWLTNEATAITESQQTIGQLAMAPKTLGAYTELSRLLMLQSTPAAEALVMNDFAKVLALAIDLAVFEGSGASGQPTGISATGSIGAVTGTSIALAGMIEFQTDLAAGNALTNGCAYITTPAVAGLLKGRARIASTDSQTLWSGSVLEGSIEGFKATTSTQLTAGSMIFGDFSQVVLGEWGMLEIALNPYASFATAITGIRAIQSVDVGVRQAAAFSRATSIT
jgi:HK97 family phage major capsid protein/HK97 family phage prohead protease